MVEVMHRPFSQKVDGFQIPGVFLESTFRSALKYEPRPDDVFVVTYPKCGTTWTQQILTLIFRQGEPISSATEFFNASPFLEASGPESAMTMPRPAAIKTHLPFHLTPFSSHAKYIYVTRNPKDCCVSYFHHMKTFSGHMFEGSFDEFFELFLAGDIDYGDYFDHLLGWYEHRHDSNVLFLTYEQMKADLGAAILKLASFMGEEFAKPLLENERLLQNVIHFSSFDYMKENVNKSMKDLMSMTREEIENSQLPKGMKEMMLKEEHAMVHAGDKKTKDINFLRKGIVGDWKNYFSPEQSQRLQEKFASLTKGTDIPEFWENQML